MTKFSNVACDRVVWRWLTRHAFSSYLGPEKISRCGKALQMLWQGSGRRAPKRFFLDLSTTRSSPCGPRCPAERGTSRPRHRWHPLDEKATPIGSATTRSHLGPCNSLRCEMAPWQDWTSLTYVWPLSVEGDLPLKYRSREICSKQNGAGQCQQISDVFLKQGRSFL